MHRRHDLIFIILLAALILIPFIPVFFVGHAFFDHGLIYSDLTYFYYALKVWYKTQITSGTFPFWTNLLGNGYPLLAEGELGALYLPNLLLYYFLPVQLAFNLNIYLHFLLAGISTYFFCRVSLKFGTFSAFLAGLAYPLSGVFFARFHLVHMIFVISYMPLTLLLVERVAATGKTLFAFLLALVFSLQILAGYIEIYYYILVLSAIYFCCLLAMGSGERVLKSLVLFAVAVGLGILISGAQLLPMWELVGQSSRAQGMTLEAASVSVWPLRTLSIFVNPGNLERFKRASDYNPGDPTTFSGNDVYGYVGLLPLLLAIVAVALSYRKKEVLIFIILLLVAFLWALGRNSPLYALLWQVLPGMKYFRFPTKLIFAVDFFLVILAGYGFEFLNTKVNKKWLLFVLLTTLVYVDLYYHNVRLQPTVAAKKWLTEVPQVISFLKENLDTSLFQIYSHGTNNLSPESVSDFEIQKDLKNILPPNLNVVYDIPANRETLALFLDRPKKLNSIANTTINLEKGYLTVPTLLKNAWALQGVKYVISDLPMQDPDLVLVKEYPFTKPVDHMVQLTDPPQTVRLKVDRVHVYENKHVFPRMALVSKITDFDNPLEAVMDPKIDIIEKASVEITSSDENTTRLKVITSKDGYLYLAKTYYPGWKAWINGREAEINRANYNFQAVSISKGTHVVDLKFEPTYWRLGIFISGLALLITFCGLGYSFSRTKPKQNHQ